MNTEGLARQAYAAFAEHSEWQAGDEAMPRWEELSARTRMAWQVAAVRVVALIFHRAQHVILGDEP